MIGVEFAKAASLLTIKYSGTRVITNTEKAVFRITNFKNPVNKDLKKGFRITTLDSKGYLVDQSEPNLALATRMTEAGTLVSKELLMLGDSNGENRGRIFEYNKLRFVLSSNIPFEQFCYFKFVFPDKLKIDEQLQLLQGDGIFKP